MASTPSPALARRLGARSARTTAATADSWEDDEELDAKAPIPDRQPRHARQGNDMSKLERHDGTSPSGHDPWERSDSSPKETASATISDWDRANATAPRIVLARTTADAGNRTSVEDSLLKSYANGPGAAGGSRSVQQVMLQTSTPRILRRPAGERAAERSSPSDSSSSPAMSPEEQAQMLKEKAERCRIARERIFGRAASADNAPQ